MFHTNASSLFFPAKLAVSFSPSPFAFRCRAAAGDLSAGPLLPRWIQSLTAGVAGGIRIGQDFDGGAVVEGSVAARRGGGVDVMRVNAREKKRSRTGESYLNDDSDALPLPMTYPDSSPVPPRPRRLISGFDAIL